MKSRIFGRHPGQLGFPNANTLIGLSELSPASNPPIRSRRAAFREDRPRARNRAHSPDDSATRQCLGDRASNVSRSCVGLTDRAPSLTERASGDAIRLTPMCVETGVYLA